MAILASCTRKFTPAGSKLPAPVTGAFAQDSALGHTSFDIWARLGYNVARIYETERGSIALANTQTAIKEIRRSARRRKINQVRRSRARTYVKRTQLLIANGQLEEAEVMARQAVSALDRAAQRGVIHKNNAARRKSRLLKHLRQAQQQQASA